MSLYDVLAGVAIGLCAAVVYLTLVPYGMI